MPAEQAAAVVEYLRSNPAAAKAAHQQAQMLLRRPQMAQAMFAGQVGEGGGGAVALRAARGWGAHGRESKEVAAVARHG